MNRFLRFLATFAVIASIAPAVAGTMLLLHAGNAGSGGGAVSCTGGTRTTSGSNTIITFTSSGTLNCTGSFAAQILVVGGGGGGSGAGGGAGGYCTTVGTPTCGLGSSVTIPSGSTAVTVGAGGAGGPVNTGGVSASNGSSSVLGSIVTALGGGGGGASNTASLNGGSGGGAGPNGTTAVAGGIGSQGNNGGATIIGSADYPGGGGGGAGTAGAAPTSDTVAGNGGNGLANSIDGTSRFYAGGGGGGFAVHGVTFGTGGTGGGGAGGNIPTAGTANTGGGGGGATDVTTGGTGTGASGGSGVVIISFGGGGGTLPPANTSRPTIPTTAQVGVMLTATAGTWTNSPTLTYQWRWHDTLALISGATAISYTPVSTDIGHTLDVVETATNAGGSASATSNATSAVIAGGALVLTPQASSLFGTSQNFGLTNNGLQPNSGAFVLPASNTGAWFIYGEATIDPYIQGNAKQFLLGANSEGVSIDSSAKFTIEKYYQVGGGTSWWTGRGPSLANTYPTVAAGSGYSTGFYPFTATGGNCAREPQGVFNPFGGSGNPVTTAAIVDPGFLCASTPTVDVSQIPGVGAQQATGPSASPPQAATTCAVVNGKAQVTAHVAVAHGINPGLTYTMQGFTPSGYNTTSTPYTALPGTSGTTLIGTTGTTSCPGAVTTEGTALSGTGATITLPAVSSLQTGINAQRAQRICFALGEYGSDSSFPGAQFMTAVDHNGNLLTGAPALVPWLNQGSADFQGYLTLGDATVATLNVTALNPYAINAATYTAASGSTPAEVTFTLASAQSGYIPGTEFTVTGVSPSGYNQTYVAAAGTSGATVVGNPISGPAGTPQALSNPGAYSSGGAAASVVMPGTHVVGSVSGSIILPYGTANSTGTGGIGTYALGGTQGPSTFTGSITGTTLSVTAAPANPLVVGSAIGGVAAGTVITGLISSGSGGGTGGNGTYIVNNSQTVGAGTSMTNAGTIGSLGASVGMFAVPLFYYNGTPFFGGVAGGFRETANSQAGIDFTTTIGAQNTLQLQQHGGWPGAIGNVSMLYGAFPQQTGGAPSTAALNSLCKKTTDIQSFAAANGLTVHSLYGLNDPGIWADSTLWSGTGYIDNPGTTTATFHVSSTQHGTPPTTGKICGVGIPGSPAACPSLSSSTLTWGSAIAANVGSSGSPVAMTAGPYNPAAPIPSTGFTGYIDAPSGVPTLHVTNVSANASFTGTLASYLQGHIDNGSGAAGKTLTVTYPPDAPDSNPVLGIGTTLTGPGVLSGTVVTAIVSGRGFAGTYTVDDPTHANQLVANEEMQGGGTLPGMAAALWASNISGTLTSGEVVSDTGVNITGQPLIITGGGPSLFNVAANYYPAFSNDTTMWATVSTPTPGQYIVNSALSTPVKIVRNIGTLSNCPTTGFPMCGAYLLSTGANGNVGFAPGVSTGPVTFTSTGITDGGAIAPGPALTIKDLGAGVTFPVTNFAAGTGTLSLSGTYDAPTLGVTPSAIQAQISNTANGPPVSGCSACAWTALSSSVISGGNWSGQAINIPASGGPLYVSVRAANATAYATMPSFVKVGLVFDLYGEGTVGGLMSAESGSALSYFTGLWGTNIWGSGQSQYVNGPPVIGSYAPGSTIMAVGDRFGVTGFGSPLSEAMGALDQHLTDATGWPVTMDDHSRNGIDIEPEVMGNIQQNQTVAVGDGAKTTWCSVATFCANVSVSGRLFFNAAAMTGATMNGASIASGVLSLPSTGGVAPAPTSPGLVQGALEPGMVLSGTGITGSPTLVNCLTGCTVSAYPSGAGPFAAQTWQTSNSSLTVGAETIRADLPGGSPWPTFALQQAGGLPFVGKTGVAFGVQLIKAGTFKISVNGIAVCQDTQAFAYSNTSGNCADLGSGRISATGTFVNYQTGDYQITFTSPPATTDKIIASWTNIVSPESIITSFNRPVGLDFFGDGGFQSGPVSSLFNKSPGGSNGHMTTACNLEGPLVSNGTIGYQFMAPGFTQMISWLYDAKYPTIPGMSAATPFMLTGQWRSHGAFYSLMNLLGLQLNCSAWQVDATTKSNFSGTIAGGVLTLSGAATGPMWEGEVLGGTSVPAGMYIASLASGAWSANGSSYNLSGASGVSIPTAAAMNNALYYKGVAQPIYGGPLNDVAMQALSGLPQTVSLSQHLTSGFAAGRRVTSRWAAQFWEWVHSSLPVSNPTLDRVKADAAGCDTSAIAAPCFDVGNTYAASATDTAISGNVLTFNGLAAHARPIIVGQAVSCSGCSVGLFVTAVSNPPTQSTVALAGQIGAANNGMTVTLNASPGVTGSGHAFTFGCSGTGGSNCIDIAFTLNTPGATALDTCGANNLNGTAENYNTPAGPCIGPGIGEIVRDFRIGTTQGMLSFAAGSSYEDGLDMFNNFAFNQSAAFTCNIVAAKVVQCVKGPVYTAGVPTSIGKWLSGQTYIAYGEAAVDAGGRIAQAMGYAGGQSFPITNGGSGYTDNVYHIPGSGCGVTGGGTIPTFDVTVHGGAIVDVYPSAAPTANAAGMGIGSSCTIPLTTVTCSGGSCGGVVPPIALAPPEGFGGIGTYNTDSNNTGVLLYDNSGEPGMPLNSFFSNGHGGYFEPGLPVQPFGGFQGAQVSG